MPASLASRPVPGVSEELSDVCIQISDSSGVVYRVAKTAPCAAFVMMAATSCGRET
jgi:hypothetical protein